MAISLVAALVFGAGDFLGGLASRRTTTLAVVIWSQAAGFLVLAVCLTFLPGTLHTGDFGWGAGCGIVGAAALGLLYRGLAIGTMGVVSPITAVLSAVLPILYGLLHQQWPTALAWLGISCAIIAVVAVAAGPAASATLARRGLLEAFGAGVLFGSFFIGLAQTRADAGLYPLVGARTASFVVFSLAALVLRVPLFPARNAIRLIVAGGVCDMLGNVLYLIAAHSGMLAIVVVVTALYPASTVALAAGFLKERLRGIQWLGVGLALAAVGCLTAAR